MTVDDCYTLIPLDQPEALAELISEVVEGGPGEAASSGEAAAGS